MGQVKKRVNESRCAHVGPGQVLILLWEQAESCSGVELPGQESFRTFNYEI